MNKPQLLDLVWEKIRVKRYSIRTERAYVETGQDQTSRDVFKRWRGSLK